MFSIIIPVYNAEKFLSTVLEAVRKQVYENWECVLVDDGSKDSSYEICRKYAEMDTRFQAYHKENGGSSSARNYGISKAKGEYIIFFDADDDIDSQFLSASLDKMKDNDLLCLGYQIIDEKGTVVENTKRHFDTEASLSPHVFFRYLYFNQYGYQGYLWNKVFRRNIIIENKLRFHEDLVYNEDRVFVAEYVLCSINNILIEANPFYYTYKTIESSLCNSGFSRRNLTELNGHDVILEKIKHTNFACYERLIKSVKCRAVANIYSKMKKIDRGVGRRLLQELLELILCPLTCKELPIKNRIGIYRSILRSFLKG